MNFVPRALSSLIPVSLLAFFTVTVPVFAQPAPAPSPAADAAPAGGEERRSRRDFNPEEMRARLEANLREQFQPENDEEWAIIKERIQKVSELRRASVGGMMGAMMAGGAFRGMMSQGGRPGDNAAVPRGRMGMSPETEALQTAIKSNAPAAEIKARLDRLREVRKAGEAKLAEAQEELRGVLSVRQEAVAVMAGLLP